MKINFKNTRKIIPFLLGLYILNKYVIIRLSVTVFSHKFEDVSGVQNNIWFQVYSVEQRQLSQLSEWFPRVAIVKCRYCKPGESFTL